MASGISGNGGSGVTTTTVKYKVVHGEPHNTDLLRRMKQDLKSMLERLKCLYLETDTDKKLAVEAVTTVRKVTDILLISTSGDSPLVDINHITTACNLMSNVLTEIKLLESRQITKV